MSTDRRCYSRAVARDAAESGGGFQVSDIDQPAAVPPHPALREYYDGASQRASFVRELFNQTAKYYDGINQYVSLGSGNLYRWRALKLAGLRPGMRVLDVAVGTGLLAAQAIRLTKNQSEVIGLDVSEGMLAEARRALDIPLIQGTAEHLPIADASIDFLSMAFGLRHVADLALTLREFHRVLRPGGRLLLIETGVPRAGWHRRLTSFYLGRLVPALCRWTTAKPEPQLLMQYYWDTVEHCIPLETILGTMQQTDFTGVNCHSVLDLFRAYTGTKYAASAIG